MVNEYLPLWHFFHDIEKELSYERFISKYLLVLRALKENWIVYDDEWVHFKAFCKTLYLQNQQDEKRFENLLNKAIDKEKQLLADFLHKEDLEGAKTNTAAVADKRGANTANNEKAAKKNDKDNSGDKRAGQQNKGNGKQDVTTEKTAPKTMYYNPALGDTDFSRVGKEIQQPGSFEYLLTDEYFPVTRRQMVKGWQFLRRSEKSGSGDQLDIRATVKKIAKDGLFLNPVFSAGVRNREDTLLIFADYRGSMAPFHELTDRLIKTAITEGGHQRAPVFYFQNYPSGYVYRQSNLSQPVKIKEALKKANRNFTLAIVISDAGAARGNTDPARKKDRKKMTDFFLRDLGESCAHIIWLNPMPLHRWKDTAAELITGGNLVMAPVIDHETYDFQETLRTILKHSKDQL